MKIEYTEGGLAIPAQPRKPERKYGALEIRNEADRLTALEALRMLRSAMHLSYCGIAFPEKTKEQHEEWHRLYVYVSEVLLGEAEEYEEKT